MLSVPQMLWLVKYALENKSRVLLAGDSAQHRSVERGDALRILEQSGTVRYVELLQTLRQTVPALKAAIEDLKAGRLQWDVLVSSTLQVSVGDRIRVTAGFREGKNVFKNNDIVEVREVTDTELVLHDARRMRRDGARIDQGVCITSHASQCRTVDQVVVLPDGAGAKGWYVSL